MITEILMLFALMVSFGAIMYVTLLFVDWVIKKYDLTRKN